MKRKSIIGAILVFVIVIGGWALYENINPKTDYEFEEFCKVSADAASKLQIRNGGTGELTVVSDPQIIEDLIKTLESITYKKVKKDPSTGWDYAVTLLAGDEEIVKITFVSDVLCTIDGCAYQIESSIGERLQEIVENA